ncbi:hypothetical protein OPQ81_000114 [Rhizoctonia solani]|nr:hypothetical protein OPQ81_000114 [Rhizoctonia solani]
MSPHSSLPPPHRRSRSQPSSTPSPPAWPPYLPSSELLSAFSAFDNDDSGQVDLTELRDALLHTAPEPGERALTAAEIDQVMSGFSGKRAFGGKGKGAGAGGFGKRGEVFRYQEFVTSIAGGGNGHPQAEEGDEETEE